MKKFVIMSALTLGGLGITTADAQFGININLHLGNRPVIAEQQPLYDDYYYLPEVEAYYSVGEHCYYYQDGGRWISAAFLPGRYHDFDWRYAKHCEIRGARPYLQHDVYRNRFGGYANRDDFYARAYPERIHNDQYRGHDQFDNRGGFESREDRGFDNSRRDARGFDDRNHAGFDNNRDRYNGGDQSNRQDFGRGIDRRPAQNQGGYSSGQSNNNGYNRGGQVTQPSQNQGGYTAGQSNSNGSNRSGQANGGQVSQPAQNTGGGYNQQNPAHGQSGGNSSGSQPSTGQGSGQHSGSAGNYGQGDHFAANQMGSAGNEQTFARPVRN